LECNKIYVKTFTAIEVEKIWVQLGTLLVSDKEMNKCEGLEVVPTLDYSVTGLLSAFSKFIVAFSPRK